MKSDQKRHYISYLNPEGSGLYIHDCVRIESGFRSINYFCICLSKFTIKPHCCAFTEGDVNKPKGNGEIFDSAIAELPHRYLELDEKTFISLIFNENSSILKTIVEDIIKRMTEE